MIKEWGHGAACKIYNSVASEREYEWSCLSHFTKPPVRVLTRTIAPRSGLIS
jgi:hypothetical protein